MFISWETIQLFPTNSRSSKLLARVVPKKPAVGHQTEMDVPMVVVFFLVVIARIFEKKTFVQERMRAAAQTSRMRVQVDRSAFVEVWVKNFEVFSLNIDSKGQCPGPNCEFLECIPNGQGGVCLNR